MFLAGLPGSGKTTLGRALLESLGDGWMFWEVDRVAPKLASTAIISPEKALKLSETELAAAFSTQWRQLRAELGAIASYARAGFHMIVERFLWDQEHLEIAQQVLKDLPHLVVELRCPLAVLEERERARQTTFVGTARSESARSWLVSADLVLDGERPTEELVEEVVRWFPSAAMSQSWV